VKEAKQYINKTSIKRIQHFTIKVGGLVANPSFRRFGGGSGAPSAQWCS